MELQRQQQQQGQNIPEDDEFEQLLGEIPRATSAPPLLEELQKAYGGTFEDSPFTNLREDDLAIKPFTDIRLEDGYEEFYREYSGSKKLPPPMENRHLYMDLPSSVYSPKASGIHFSPFVNSLGLEGSPRFFSRSQQQQQQQEQQQFLEEVERHVQKQRQQQQQQVAQQQQQSDHHNQGSRLHAHTHPNLPHVSTHAHPHQHQGQGQGHLRDEQSLSSGYRSQSYSEGPTAGGLSGASPLREDRRRGNSMGRISSLDSGLESMEDHAAHMERTGGSLGGFGQLDSVGPTSRQSSKNVTAGSSLDAYASAAVAAAYGGGNPGALDNLNLMQMGPGGLGGVGGQMTSRSGLEGYGLGGIDGLMGAQGGPAANAVNLQLYQQYLRSQGLDHMGAGGIGAMGGLAGGRGPGVGPRGMGMGIDALGLGAGTPLDMYSAAALQGRLMPQGLPSGGIDMYSAAALQQSPYGLADYDIAALIQAQHRASQVAALQAQAQAQRLQALQAQMGEERLRQQRQQIQQQMLLQQQQQQQQQGGGGGGSQGQGQGQRGSYMNRPASPGRGGGVGGGGGQYRSQSPPRPSRQLSGSGSPPVHAPLPNIPHGGGGGKPRRPHAGNSAAAAGNQPSWAGGAGAAGAGGGGHLTGSLCKYFVQGFCSRGDTCPFPHSLPASGAAPGGFAGGPREPPEGTRRGTGGRERGGEDKYSSSYPPDTKMALPGARANSRHERGGGGGPPAHQPGSRHKGRDSMTNGHASNGHSRFGPSGPAEDGGDPYSSYHDSQGSTSPPTSMGGGQGHPKYTSLEEVEGQIYSIAKDQHGCRFLQRKFDEGGPADVAKIFEEIIVHIQELMVDSFGNYLVQKLLEVCSQEQRLEILHRVTRSGELVDISLNMHGTRAVQKLIETLAGAEQTAMVIAALQPGVVTLIKDLNGNHVIQRCLQRLGDDAMFIYDAAARNCVEIATHRHGCCVLQRCIDFASTQQKDRLVAEVAANALVLSQDAFGNYVVQYILDLNLPWATRDVMTRLEGNYPHLSQQKFSSNVVEKCLKLSQEDTRARLVREMVASPRLGQLLQDPFANYVIQSALTVSKGPLHSALVEAIRPHAANLRSSPYGKRILSRTNLKK